MRKQYTEVLKIFFHKKLYARRKALGISQEEMAERLSMGCRGYARLDQGQMCCSALTLGLFLIYICEDPLTFLKELRYALENCDKEAA